MHIKLPFEERASLQVGKILKWILVLNVLVFVIKLFIGFKSHSLSIIADGIHSGIDSFNNVLGIVMIGLAAEPPDKKHPYGHSKFETLGALAVVAFLVIASFELIEKSITRLLNPAAYPQIDDQTIYLLVLTLAINIFVWVYENKAADRLHSQLLKADAAHTFSDILITISILASMIFIARGYLWLDPLLGLFIAIVILRSGWIILKQTVPILVDEAWLQPEQVHDLVYATDKVIKFEDFRSRKGHEYSFVEMTVKFNTDSLSEAHRLSHEIETKIINKFGEAQVTIHIEPNTDAH